MGGRGPVPNPGAEKGDVRTQDNAMGVGRAWGRGKTKPRHLPRGAAERVGRAVLPTENACKQPQTTKPALGLHVRGHWRDVRSRPSGRTSLLHVAPCLLPEHFCVSLVVAGLYVLGPAFVQAPPPPTRYVPLRSVCGRQLSANARRCFLQVPGSVGPVLRGRYRLLEGGGVVSRLRLSPGRDAALEDAGRSRQSHADCESEHQHRFVTRGGPRGFGKLSDLSETFMK